MICLGFGQDWIDLVMNCVSTTLAILINGVAFGSISPSRGLRQEDPLSPYLFLLCSEGLSHMIKKEYLKGNLTGVPVSNLCIPITHLFFADDSLIFLKPTSQEFGVFKLILQAYEKASS